MLNNKKFAAGLICVGIVAAIAAITVSIFLGKDYRTDVPQELDEAVALSTFTRLGVSMSDITINGETRHYADVGENWTYNDETPYKTECLGEGHVILGYREKDSTVEVYAICEADEYCFQNGWLWEWSSYSCMPTLLIFDKDKDGSYLFKSAEEPSEDPLFGRPVSEFFPSDLVEIAVTASGDSEIGVSLSRQSLQYAEAYLVSIGRDGKLGVYCDEDQEITSLEGAGVAEKVAAALYDLHPEYGVYTGTIEKREGGKRYVYAVSWDGDLHGNGTVTYSKTEYDTQKVVEEYSYKVKEDQYSLVKPKKKK